MSEYGTDQQRYLDPGIRRFWPNFVVSALLTPLMTVLLLGLTLPGNVVGFYVVTLVAAPAMFALVLLPSWRLVRKPGAVLVRLATVLLSLPTLALFLWCCYCDVWLLSLVLTGNL
jgi:hypothetical protein